MYKFLLKRYFLLLFVFSCWLAYPKNVKAETVTIYPSADANIFSRDTRNYGGGCGMWLGRPNWTDAPNYWGLLKFEFSQIPDYATINSATLSLYFSNTQGSSLPILVSLSRITSYWSETGVLWTNKPASESTGITGILGPSTGRYYSFNVTSLVNGWYKYTYYNGGLYVKSNIDWYSMLRVNTRECSQNTRPKIVVNYTPYRLPPSPTPTRRPTPTPTVRIVRFFISPTPAVRFTWASSPTPTPTIRHVTFSNPSPTPSIHIFRLASPTPTPTGAPSSRSSVNNPRVLDTQIEVTDTTARITILTDKDVVTFIDYGIPPETYVGSQIAAQYTTMTVLNIGGLLPATTYMYGIAVEDEDENETYVPEGGTGYFTTDPTDNGGGSVPVGGSQISDEVCQGSDSGNIFISDIRIDDRSDTGAVFKWNTKGCYQNVLDNRLSSSWVYVSENAVEDTPYDEYELNFGRADRAFNHEVIAKYLKSNTFYFYKIVSKDSDGNIGISPMGTFKTLEAPADGSGLVDPLGISGEMPVSNPEMEEGAESVDQGTANSLESVFNSSGTGVLNKILGDGILSIRKYALTGVLIFVIIILLLLLLTKKKKVQEKEQEKEEEKDQEEKEEKQENKEKSGTKKSSEEKSPDKK